MAQTNIPQRQELLCSAKTMGVFISSALLAFSSAEHLLHQAAQIELGDDSFRTPERTNQLDALHDSAEVFSETGELLLYSADNVATFYIQTGHAIASDVPGRASARRSSLAISRKDSARTTPTA